MTTTAPEYEADLLEPLLRPREVCDLLNISRRTLSRLVVADELHPVRVGGSSRFRPADVRGLLRRGGCSLNDGDRPGRPSDGVRS